MIETLYNEQALERAGEFFAEDYVGYYPFGEMRGVEAIRRHFAGDHTGWPDSRLIVDDLVAEDDQVVVRWTWQGTQTRASFLGAPTGKVSTCPGVTIARLRDGRIVEAWWTWDNLSWLRRLGAITVPWARATTPAPEAAPAPEAERLPVPA
jgi:steroid delta-isomerase-like uncharacterized protein